MIVNHRKNDTLVTFRIAKDDLDVFDYIANEKRISRAALLRGCVVETNKKHIGDVQT